MRHAAIKNKNKKPHTHAQRETETQTHTQNQVPGHPLRQQTHFLLPH